MIKSVAFSVGFSVLVFAAQPAFALWPFGDDAGQFAGSTAPKERYAARSHLEQAPAQASDYEAMIAQHAGANNVPASLIHRVIMRESRYNPHAVSAGNYGLMQIRLGTARAMGYTGTAAGLLDAQTNMTYAVRYLAGAYRAAKGNETLAVALYARGYNARGYNSDSKEVNY
jgi:soluble lytic murein transglycosylase-like protein